MIRVTLKYEESLDWLTVARMQFVSPMLNLSPPPGRDVKFLDTCTDIDYIYKAGNFWAEGYTC